MAIVTFVLVGLGTALILTGSVISIMDWNRRHRIKPDGGVVTEGTSVSEAIQGLAKLAEALRDYPLGMQLVFVGVVILIVAGVFGGIASL